MESAACRRLAALALGILLLWAQPARAADPDTLTLVDGEQLIGKLVKVLAGAVTFHSDILGDVTVPMAKVKTLHASQFAVVAKDQHVTRKTAAAQVPVGVIAVEDNTIHVTPAAGEEKTYPAANVDFLIDPASFNREIQSESSFRYGWAGSVTLGASLVESTNTSQTYTGAITMARSIPTTPWLPPSSKTILDLSGSYGLAKNPEIDMGTTVLQPASETKTDILHGDAEYDKYWSQKLYGLVNASADHDFGSGLQLQQAYGGGLGWSVLKNPKNDLDLKAEIEYQQQQFYQGFTSSLGTPSLNLVSAGINETWQRNFVHGMKLNEFITLNPTFNVPQAYSAVANAIFAFPVYKRLNFSLSSTDNYLGDPPQGYMRNTFQFTAGVTYVVK